MENGHEARFAYALWGIAWAIIGIYDETLAEDWCTKYFVSLITLAIFSIWTGYELGFIKFSNVKKAMMYFAMYIVGINNWNVAFCFMAILHRGYDWMKDNVWLAPNIYVPSWLYILMTVAGFIVWLSYGVFINIKKDYLEVYKVIK